MARETLGVVIIGLLFMLVVPKTVQLRVDHPLHRIVERINDDGPFLGFLLSTAGDEENLLNSGYFVTSTSTPYVDVAGRRFNVGKFLNVPTVYVVTSAPLASVSVTVQLLLDTFRVKGVVDYGGAASLSDKVALADVAVLSQAAFTGVWSWEQWEDTAESDNEVLPSLRFGEYNVPTPGENKLAKVKFQTVKQYSPTSSKKQTFWFDVDQEWLQLASQLEDMSLDKCMNATFCIGTHVPRVVYGVKGSSSDVLLSNEAYGNFLNEKFGVATVDRKSAATVSTATANGVPHIVFRAASNKPGVAYDSKVSELAKKNSLKVVAAFVERLVAAPSTSYF